MRTLVGILAGLSLVVLAGCGQTRPATRAHVAAYLKQVDHVEAQLRPPLVSVTRVSARIATGRARASAPAATHVLASMSPLSLDLRQIRLLGARLAAIPAPPAAAHLRTILVALVEDQASLTHETSQLQAFLPAFNAALEPLAPASLRLERVLTVHQAYGPAAVQSVLAAKADALRAFQATLRGVLERLARLRPPAVSRENARAQVAAIRGMGASAGKLAAALAAGDSAAIPSLLVAFDHAAAIPQSERVRRAQVAAARAYNRQTVRLQRLAAEAAAERTRLQRTLP
ncbi:MAG: hypothetical protein ACJ780_04275 [Solirubrobacteraceae bacterium]